MRQCGVARTLLPNLCLNLLELSGQSFDFFGNSRCLLVARITLEELSLFLSFSIELKLKEVFTFNEFGIDALTNIGVGFS